MARTVVCPACKQPADDTCVRYKSKLYHPVCFDKMKTAAAAKDIAKAARASDPDYLALVDYICGLFKLTALTPLLEKQVKNYAQRYSYGDLLYTLRYFFEIESSDEIVEGEPTIGIVPYVYSKAMDHQRRLQAAFDHNRSFVPSADETVYVVKRASRYTPYTYDIADL